MEFVEKKQAIFQTYYNWGKRIADLLNTVEKQSARRADV